MRSQRAQGPLTSVIIVTYNNQKDIVPCLRSLFSQEYSAFETIVVDNGSQDQTIANVEKFFPDVLVIRNTNKGYGQGNNLGVARASGKYIAFLNPDTTVQTTWLSHLVKFCERHPSAGAVQPVILNANENTVNTAGLLVNFLGFSWCKNYKSTWKGGRGAEEIDAFSGAAVLLPKSVFLKVSGFDESYFLFHEDVDLSLRIRLAGYTLYVHRESVIYHSYTYNNDPWRYYLLERNRLMTILKNYHLRTLILFSPALLFWEVGMVLFSLYDGWFFKKMKSYWYIFTHIVSLLQKRRIIQNFRVITDGELMKRYLGTVFFENINNGVLIFLANPISRAYWTFIRGFI